MLRSRLYDLRYGFVPTFAQALIRLMRTRCHGAT